MGEQLARQELELQALALQQLEPLLGELVYIYFGMRRGGSEYYGLDVTNRNAPVRGMLAA